METRFPQIRQRSMALAIAASLCFGFAAIAAATLSIWWMMPLITAGFLALLCVPFAAKKRSAESSSPKTTWLSLLLDWLRTASVIWFLTLSPWSDDLFSWLSQGKLLNWPFFFLVAVFTASLARRLCVKVQAMTDREIYDFYRRSDTPPPQTAAGEPVK